MTPHPQPNEDSLKEMLAYQIHDTSYCTLIGQNKMSIDQAVTAIQALYAPKPDETVEKILQAVYNNGRMADKKLLETNKEDILPWMSVNQAEAVLAAHYAAKEQETVLRATANSKKLITELISLYGVPICDNLHHPKKYQHGPFQKCPVEVRLAIITNQLNKMKGEK